MDWMDVSMNGCISGCHTYLIYFLGKGRREGAQTSPLWALFLSSLRAKDFGGALFFFLTTATLALSLIPSFATSITSLILHIEKK